MWKCTKCNRSFKTKNQSHTCTNIDMGELFIGKPDDLVLALDRLLIITTDWQPNEVGVAKNAIVFTSKKAWLIVKPMSKQLDIKFYHTKQLESIYIHKTATWKKKIAYHVRVTSQEELSREIIELIRKGYEYSLK